MFSRKYYAGIGSRKTPAPILAMMQQIGKALALQGYWLRSGHADGADQAFETGSDIVSVNQKEIWLPWDGFNGAPKYEDTNGWTHRIGSKHDEEIAAEFHPNWRACSAAAKLMHIRNVAQILGSWVQPVPSPDDPDPDYGGGAYEPYRTGPKSSFVICWTEDGRATGGTGQALRIAKHFEVPILNLHDSLVRQRTERWLASL